jgi:hypothetical protein
MSDTKEAIRNMVQSLLKDNETQAQVDLHPVFTTKIKELTGVSTDDSNRNEFDFEEDNE